MSTFKKLAIAFGVLIGGCIITGLAVPAGWEAEGSVVIDAPSERIHPWIEDFHRWRQWAGPRQPDASVEYSYAGPDKGVGAEQSWRGDRSRGAMKILSSDSKSGLEFETAMLTEEVNGAATIRYAPEGNGTRVTWKGHGSSMPLLGHLFSRAIARGISDYYDHSLSQLKAKVEAEAK